MALFKILALMFVVALAGASDCSVSSGEVCADQGSSIVQRGIYKHTQDAGDAPTEKEATDEGAEDVDTSEQACTDFATSATCPNQCQWMQWNDGSSTCLPLDAVKATVSCGKHNATSCADCPEGAASCNGVCHWDDLAHTCQASVPPHDPTPDSQSFVETNHTQQAESSGLNYCRHYTRNPWTCHPLSWYQSCPPGQTYQFWEKGGCGGRYVCKHVFSCVQHAGSPPCCTSKGPAWYCGWVGPFWNLKWECPNGYGFPRGSSLVFN